jgi:hypothetical protein
LGEGNKKKKLKELLLLQASIIGRIQEIDELHENIMMTPDCPI